MINSNNNLGGLNSVSATTFYGDGSNLTGISGGGGTFTGGTVTGPTNFTSTLSAQTITLDTTYTGTTGVGTISWNTDFGVPQVGMIGGNVIGKINESVYAYVKNVDSSTLNKGEVVYIFGASGDKMSVKRASATGDTTSSKTLGVVAESIGVNGLGYIVTQGTLDGLNLGAYTAGDILWLGETPGTLTNIKKYAPNHLVFVGVVQRANSGNGQLYVKPQNGYELEELHNVKATGATNGDLLVYNSGTTLWENRTNVGSFGITIDGGGSAITTGIKGYVEIPYSGTITSWTILADQTGSAVIDLWKDTYASFPPTSGDSITASAIPTLTSDVKAQSSTLTGWNITVNAGDLIGFNVVSASDATRVTLSVKINKS
jgi:hypothetical protein